MFKKFYDYIIENGVILEGGHSYSNISRIRKEDIKPTLDVFLAPLFKKLKISETDIRYLGSTGKKVTSGDIDILIDGKKIANTFKLQDHDEIPQKIYDDMKSIYGKDFEMNYTKALKVSNIAFPIYNVNGQTDEFVQIDLMTTFDDGGLDYGEFFYNSPDITKNESIFSGAHRSELVRLLFGFIKRPEDVEFYEYFDDEFDGKYKGEMKQFVKLSLLPTGLTLQTKSFLGKTKPLKNPKTIKALDKFISNNPDFISNILLDGKGTPMDLNSFESIWAFIETGKSKELYEQRAKIANAYNDKILQKKNIEVPNQIKKYL